MGTYHSSDFCTPWFGRKIFRRCPLHSWVQYSLFYSQWFLFMFGSYCFFTDNDPSIFCFGIWFNTWVLEHSSVEIALSRKINYWWTLSSRSFISKYAYDIVASLSSYLTVDSLALWRCRQLYHESLRRCGGAAVCTSISRRQLLLRSFMGADLV